ncbi:hypothetical protein JDV02_003005 [Purpureocillium takamizusanense]|uniref:Heterokaryon incompatibility domain-containing protein n=1 Tax=Purpureocillium takamizusanense TaxID=2060973 RepID=A0A9Q8V971_9HYPO|nr:uncharacterized protein JDV02_003005 [Purpureocillium takamizusanense]UNI16579.1 hypothetical protein JDV02_003005 [Purpureocillium takamizusanense]
MAGKMTSDPASFHVQLVSCPRLNCHTTVPYRRHSDISAVEMQLCHVCNSLTLAFLLEAPGCHGSGHGSHRDGRVLCESGAALSDSATSCVMCALMMEALSSHSPGRNNSYHARGPIALSADAIMVHPKTDPRRLNFPGAPCEGAYVTGFVVTGRSRESGQLLSGKIRLYKESFKGMDGRCDVLGRPQLSGPDGPDAFALITQWLQACRRDHSTCSTCLSGESIVESDAPPLPTRVLLIGKGHVRLVDAQGQRGRYVTLSHCWGPSLKRPLRTTKGNYESHREGILWTSLPRTFQDAITVARKIGFDYIWIDSLCIVQDDQEDWLRESGTMGSIYELADLTIAACHAADPSQGLFVPRPCRNPAVEIPSFFGGLGTRQEKVYATVRRETVEDTFPEYGPLNRRAWSTQEWLLSRRMLFYTNGTIMWSCKAVTERENGERCFNISRNTRWKTVVEHYSERLLTFPTDKLIALEGLRKALQTRTGYTFAHGVWLESLPDQLLWHATEQVHVNDAADPLDLPTWTWAHVPTSVRFLPIHRAKSLCDSISLSTDSKTLIIRSRMKRLATIKPDLSPGCEDDETSQAIAADVNATHASNTPALASFLYDETLRPIGWAVYEQLADYAAATQYWCVQLMGRVSRRGENTERREGKSTDAKLREYWVLIVRPHPDGGYVRVGAGKTYGQRWWESAPVQRIVLR